MTSDATLARFVDAQAASYAAALAEIRTDTKRSHWMWFIFPQLRGLGQSPTAHYYGIASLEEALAYLNHELLAPAIANASKHCSSLAVAILLPCSTASMR